MRWHASHAAVKAGEGVEEGDDGGELLRRNAIEAGMGCPAMTLTEADKECFKLAIELVRKRGGGDQQQIEKVLSARGFESAGHFACYSCQVDVLGVRPWQPVPSCAFIREGWQDFIARGDDATLGKYAASVLLRQMLGLGISPYHPDPKGAIAEAEATNKRRPKSREPV